MIYKQRMPSLAYGADALAKQAWTRIETLLKQSYPKPCLIAIITRELQLTFGKGSLFVKKYLEELEEIGYVEFLDDKTVVYKFEVKKGGDDRRIEGNNREAGESIGNDATKDP